MAFTTPLGEGTNIKADIEASIFGFTWSLELRYRNIEIEVDKLLVVEWILEKHFPNGSS